MDAKIFALDSLATSFDLVSQGLISAIGLFFGLLIGLFPLITGFALRPLLSRSIRFNWRRWYWSIFAVLQIAWIIAICLTLMVQSIGTRPDQARYHAMLWPPPRPFSNAQMPDLGSPPFAFESAKAFSPDDCLKTVNSYADRLRSKDFAPRYLYLMTDEQRVIDGIAIVSALDFTDESGLRKRKADLDFSFTSRFIKPVIGFFTAPNQRARVFVFTFTGDSYGENPRELMTEDGTKSMYGRGLLRPPEKTISQMCKSRWHVTALVYEFRQDADGTLKPMEPEFANSAKRQLDASGISDGLPKD